MPSLLKTSADPKPRLSAYRWVIGVMFNMDMLAPGDKLWLQAAYENGAVSYVDGSNLVFTNGAVNADRAPGNVSPILGVGWNHGQDYDCVWTGSGTCEKQSGFEITSAYKHYWMPTLSSAVFGSFLRFNYTANAINGFDGAVGMDSFQEIRAGTNLIWTPVKGLDIGGEFMYSRQQQLASSAPAVVVPAGFPTWTSSSNVYEGRLRVQRAF